MNDATTDAAKLFAPLWRRKWMILAVAIIVAGATYEYYKRKPAVYAAKTSLYLGGGSEQQAGGTVGKATISGRAVADQVELINSIIREAVHRRLREEHRIVAAQGKAKAVASGTSDFITITSEAKNPRSAVLLANDTAAAYVKRQRQDYLRSLKAQIENTRQQIRRIEPPVPTKGSKGSIAPSSTTTIQSANLHSKLSQLESSLSSFSGVQQVAPARAEPLPISPSPKKNAVFGFFLGLLLASIAAYALGRFDRRLRSLAAVEEIYKTQILSALPVVGAPAIRPDGSRAPARSLIEPLRRLHNAVRLGDAGSREHHGAARVLLFLSADGGDGRSSLVANLAHVQCDSGEQVAIVEADFRRPVQQKLMDVSGARGLADVLAGGVQPSLAMQSAHTQGPEAASDPLDSGAGLATVVDAGTSGSLSVLLSGGPVSNPPALLGSDAMAELLRTLAEEYDHVLIDAPPPLEVSDVLPLLPLVDGIIIVARIGHTRDTSARRLAQLLERTASAPILGAVANCVPRKDIARYGFSVISPEPGRRKLIRR
jgi:Mrp family chromosome partitioning ATPase/capsular polysaccharide biosynthesis protein